MRFYMLESINTHFFARVDTNYFPPSIGTLCSPTILTNGETFVGDKVVKNFKFK